MAVAAGSRRLWEPAPSPANDGHGGWPDDRDCTRDTYASEGEITKIQKLCVRFVGDF